MKIKKKKNENYKGLIEKFDVVVRGCQVFGKSADT